MKVRQKFNQYATDYDEARQKLIPCFNDFYRAVLKIIPHPTTANIHVLDLGAGTGLLSKMILEVYPNGHINLVDISENMLNIAKERLGSYNNVTYNVLDYAVTFPNQTFDLIISSLSIHHLSDPEKQRLFANIKLSLGPNGIFINADQVLGENAAIEALHQKTWLQEVKDNGVSKTALSQALDRMQEDKMATLSSQLDWLQEQGFTDIHCWYKNYRFAVYSGRTQQG